MSTSLSVITLPKIRTLPEHTRYILAGTCLVISLVAVFSGWLAAVSSRLDTFSMAGQALDQTAASAAGTAAPSDSALSPAAGLGESFKGLEKLITPEQDTADFGLWHGIARLGAGVIFALHKTPAWLAETVTNMRQFAYDHFSRNARWE